MLIGVLALLLGAGAAGAAASLAPTGDDESRTVSVTGDAVDTVDVPAPPPPVLPGMPIVAPPVSSPPSTLRGTTTSTRGAPVPTRPAPLPTPSTSTSAVPVATSTTSTTARARPPASVTVLNTFSHDLVVILNGARFEVSPGRQSGPQDLALPLTGDDVIEVTVRERPLCDLDDTGDFFQPGGRYRVEVYAFTASCHPMDVLPGPGLRVTAF